jgi:hypothetical protein
MEVTVAEYRSGNAKENSVMKATGLNKATDVTRKRACSASSTSTAGLTRSAAAIRTPSAASSSSFSGGRRPRCRGPVRAQGAAS